MVEMGHLVIQERQVLLEKEGFQVRTAFTNTNYILKRLLCKVCETIMFLHVFLHMCFGIILL